MKHKVYDLILILLPFLIACSFSEATAQSTNASSSTQYIPIVQNGDSNSTNGYYIDSVNGSDANSGKSSANPWRTLAPVNSHKFLPGDTIYFKRGSSWTGGLQIKNSGVEGNPITYTAYGSGASPIFRNPGSAGQITRAITVEASWIVVSDLSLQDATDAGIRIYTRANYNIIKNLEITNVGIGITLSGQFNLATKNNIHDLHMVKNTQGGDDDYGAIGVGVFNSNNEISYNRMINCKAASYDYGTDGGAIELYGNVDNSYIHHNWSYNNEGFMEIGSSNDSGSVNNVNVSYNVVYNSGRMFGFHTSGTYATNIHNFVADNNTFIDVADQAQSKWSTFYFTTSVTPDEFIIRNSIFYVGNYQYLADAANRGWNFTHQNNLYFMANPITKLGFSLGYGEYIGNPQFSDINNQDFNLKIGSLAIDNGLDLKYSLDFNNNPVPMGSNPDIGAFEYQGPP